MLAKGTDSNAGGDAVHEAIDWLLMLLRSVRDELRAGGELEPTVEQCCEAMARKSASYNDAFGCHMLVRDNGRRLTNWGYQITTQSGYFIEYVETDLTSLLEAVASADGAPDWWDDSWTCYEYRGNCGQTLCWWT
ncbi:hypothetical protein RI103_02320 [Paraburkholderia sp. FT54]|uniref:hypothetical protein n=1 Tax=Paraburkholderia sp. FT54 TaxID=3074437 RepID=UPI002877BB8E|nr:hypothetical protein [Paraburkholderia sp. FT54]WNC90217.1 hypothetical protein RI103_02320 [Paraburkholderia sp. FT54]